MLKPAVEDDVVHGGYYLCDGEYGEGSCNNMCNSRVNINKRCALSSHACDNEQFSMYKK